MFGINKKINKNFDLNLSYWAYVFLSNITCMYMRFYKETLWQLCQAVSSLLCMTTALIAAISTWTLAESIVLLALWVHQMPLITLWSVYRIWVSCAPISVVLCSCVQKEAKPHLNKMSTLDQARCCKMAEDISYRIYRITWLQRVHSSDLVRS
jgi:hypothetical protein